MGNLRFTPNIDKKYNIRLSKPMIDSVFILKEIYPKGVSMRLVQRDKDYLFFKVTQSPWSKQCDGISERTSQGCCLLPGNRNIE